MVKKILLSLPALLVPSMVFAQSLGPIMTFISAVNSLVARLIPLLIAVAMVAFFWGLIKYIRGGKKFAAQGKNIMIAGLASLFVMVSVWGIVNLAANALGVDSNNGVRIPTIPGTGQYQSPYPAGYQPVSGPQ